MIFINLDFQVGTVVAGSADFFSSRVPKRERKQNLVDELLADAEFRRFALHCIVFLY